MKVAASTLVLVIGLTACGGRAAPPSRPSPVSASTRSAAAVAARRDTTRVPDSIPTVVITGSVKVGSELPVGSARSYSVLRKPFDDQALLDAVAAAIRCGSSPDDGT